VLVKQNLKDWKIIDIVLFNAEIGFIKKKKKKIMGAITADIIV
jgi:hypothetical protein